MALRGNAARVLEYVIGIIDTNRKRILAGELDQSDYAAWCKIVAELERIKTKINEEFAKEDVDE